MSAAVLDASTLGYLTGAVFAAIVVVLAVSLITVNALVAGVRDHVRSVKESLAGVAGDTDPVPPTLTAINVSLGELAVALGDVAGHMATARTVFDHTAEGR